MDSLVYMSQPSMGILTCASFFWLKVSNSVFLLKYFVKILGVDANIRDKYGFSASYWAKQNTHREVMELLPNPLKIGKEEYFEHMKVYWAAHGVKSGGGKKKKGKGKKKK